jgi:hypothetical protein
MTKCTNEVKKVQGKKATDFLTSENIRWMEENYVFREDVINRLILKYH